MRVNNTEDKTLYVVVVAELAVWCVVSGRARDTSLLFIIVVVDKVGVLHCELHESGFDCACSGRTFE